ncbi:MAG: hypothetical protein OEL87_00420 [Nanoarchaeota archaeon]|nr:hypothetical protein [Nanoarchaeota archaeon]
MRNSYHDQVLEKFCSEIQYFTGILGFAPLRIGKNMQLGSAGEIDVLLYGEDQRALVEVKSHGGLIRKFTEKQFHIYHDYDPKAAIYLLLGNSEKSLEPEDFHFKRYWPLSE